ncbi:hypothetical protein GW17_00052802 [Ensete ventricosum]|nr:hypothetical protein GW17_00052802 [Ensete ventricosum]
MRSQDLRDRIIGKSSLLCPPPSALRDTDETLDNNAEFKSHSTSVFVMVLTNAIARCNSPVLPKLVLEAMQRKLLLSLGEVEVRQNNRVEVPWQIHLISQIATVATAVGAATRLQRKEQRNRSREAVLAEVEVNDIIEEKVIVEDLIVPMLECTDSDCTSRRSTDSGSRVKSEGLFLVWLYSVKNWWSSCRLGNSSITHSVPVTTRKRSPRHLLRPERQSKGAEARAMAGEGTYLLLEREICTEE